VGYEGILRPDHVPTMEGTAMPTRLIQSVGRLFAIGPVGAAGLPAKNVSEEEIYENH
jgi:hypothetical protein